MWGHYFGGAGVSSVQRFHCTWNAQSGHPLKLGEKRKKILRLIVCDGNVAGC